VARVAVRGGQDETSFLKKFINQDIGEHTDNMILVSAVAALVLVQWYWCMYTTILSLPYI